MTASEGQAESGEGGPPSTVQLILLVAGGHRFAVPILDVREVLSPGEFTRLPGKDPAVAGLLNVRGRILTVVDFGRALGLDPSEGREGNRILVLDDGSRRLGLLVDEVGRVTGLPEESVDHSREALAVFPVNRPYLVGVGEVEGEPVALLDAARMVTRWFG